MYRKLAIVIVVSIDWNLCLRLVVNTGQTCDRRKHRLGFMLTTRRKHLTNWRSLLRKRNRKLAIVVSIAWDLCLRLVVSIATAFKKTPCKHAAVISVDFAFFSPNYTLISFLSIGNTYFSFILLFSIFYILFKNTT